LADHEVLGSAEFAHVASAVPSLAPLLFFKDLDAEVHAFIAYEDAIGTCYEASIPV